MEEIILGTLPTLPTAMSVFVVVVMIAGVFARWIYDARVTKKTEKKSDDRSKNLEEIVVKVSKQVSCLEKKVEEIDSKVDENHRETIENQVVNLRHDIISHADIILSKDKPTDDLFDIFEDLIDRYVKLSEKYEIKDGKVMFAIRSVNKYKHDKLGSYMYSIDTLEKYESIIRGI